MAASCTIKLLNTIEWAKKLNFGRRSALGNYLEPALTSANTILETILGPPFAWRWNRVVTGFVCTAGQQDYYLINWAATTAVAVGTYTVDDAGNSQRVTTAGTTGASAPSWNHTKTGTTTDGTATWTNLGQVAVTGGIGAAQTYSLLWMETVSAYDVSATTPKWYELTTKLRLASETVQSRPQYISAQGDDGLGNITFRLMAVPDTAYPVAITLQQKPPLFTKTSQLWAPVPDEYSRIYNWGFLSLMWLFADDPRFDMANRKFVASLLGAAEGLTETQRDIFLQNWQNTIGQPLENSDNIAQGTQARGV